MSKLDIQSIRKKLNEMRSRLTGEVSSLRTATLGIQTTDDSADQSLESGALASHMTEENSNLTLLGNEQQLLESVVAALDRLDQGEFGKCEDCQKPISAKRLEAIPYARHCVACARRLESPSNFDVPV